MRHHKQRDSAAILTIEKALQRGVVRRRINFASGYPGIVWHASVRAAAARRQPCRHVVVARQPGRKSEPTGRRFEKGRLAKGWLSAEHGRASLAHSRCGPLRASVSRVLAELYTPVHAY